MNLLEPGTLGAIGAIWVIADAIHNGGYGVRQILQNIKMIDTSNKTVFRAQNLYDCDPATGRYERVLSAEPYLIESIDGSVQPKVYYAMEKETETITLTSDQFWIPPEAVNGDPATIIRLPEETEYMGRIGDLRAENDVLKAELRSQTSYMLDQIRTMAQAVGDVRKASGATIFIPGKGGKPEIPMDQSGGMEGGGGEA